MKLYFVFVSTSKVAISIYLFFSLKNYLTECEKQVNFIVFQN